MAVQKVKIEIDTKTFIRFWLVIAGFFLAGYLIYSASAALLIIFISVFLAIAFSKPVNRLVKTLPGKSRALSTALSYGIVVLLFVGIIGLVVPPVVDQTAKFVKSVPSLIDESTKKSSPISQFIDRYNLRPAVDQLSSQIQNSATKSIGNVGDVVLSSIKTVISIVTALILIFVLTFLMLVEGPKWINWFWSTYSNKDRLKRHQKLAYDMYNLFTNSIMGQVTVSSIAGLVSGIIVYILSFFTPIPVSLVVPAAAIVFVTSLVPMFGAMIGAILISAVLALSSLSAAAIFLVAFIIYQQIEGNFISPTIQSKRVDLSPLLILLAVTIGVYLFGILGGIISIPVAGSIKILIEDLTNFKTKSAKQ